MKLIVHWPAFAGTVAALGLFAMGSSKEAWLILGLTTVGEVLASAITGKQGNTSLH